MAGEEAKGSRVNAGGPRNAGKANKKTSSPNVSSGTSQSKPNEQSSGNDKKYSVNRWLESKEDPWSPGRPTG